MVKKFSVIGIIILFKKIDLRLKNEDFQNVIEGVVRHAEKEPLKKYTETERKKVERKIYKSIDNIETASTLYWNEAKCLHRVIVQYMLYREKYGMPVKMVIGVKKFPFASHMWLEWQSKQRDLVCEYEENIVGYDVIFDSDKNIER